MEIFRPLSGLAEAVSSRGPPLAHWRKFVYCESMTGAILGEVDHFQVCAYMSLLPLLELYKVSGLEIHGDHFFQNYVHTLCQIGNAKFQEYQL